MLQSGSISLARIIDFVRSNPEVPHNKEEVFLAFRLLYEQLLAPIPRIPGWYAWVKSDNSAVEPIYVGRSFRGKSSDIKIST